MYNTVGLTMWAVVTENAFSDLLNMIKKTDRDQLVGEYKNNFGVVNSVYYQRAVKEAQERKKYKTKNDNELIFKRYFLAYLQEEFGSVLDDKEKLRVLYNNDDEELNTKNIARHLLNLMTGKIEGPDGRQIDRELILFILFNMV